jgi:hypothetical protein
MIDIKPLKEDKYLEFLQTSQDVQVITKYLDVYMETIQIQIQSMMQEVGLDEAKRVKRADHMFVKDIELSVNRKKLLGNVIGTLKGFKKGHTFYNSAQTIPKSLQSYFVSCVYEVVQSLTLGVVLKTIELSNGQESLFSIIYDETQALNYGVVTGTRSITIRHDDKEFKLGSGGISVIDYYNGIEKKPQKQWQNPNKYGTSMNLRLKTDVAEEIGMSFFMRAFKVPSNQWNKAVIPLPLGKTAFPDFILDTVELDEQVNEGIFTILGTPRTRYILVDVKASITKTGTSFGSIRFRYPRVSRVNNFMYRSGIMEPGQKLFDKDIPPEQFKPVHFTSQQFLELVKFYINDLYTETAEYAKGTKGVSSFGDVQSYLTGNSITVIYEEVGTNTGTQPKFYAADILPDTTYSVQKTSNTTYPIIRDGMQVATFKFYNGSLAQSLPDEVKQRIVKSKKTNPGTPEASGFGREDVEVEGEDFEDEDTDSEEYKTNAAAIQAHIPEDNWLYMFKWNRAGLRDLEIPAFEPTYRRAKAD